MIKRSKQEIIDFIKWKVGEISSLNMDEIDEKSEFSELGLDSVNGLFVLNDLEEFLNDDVDPLAFWNYPTIESLSGYLAEEV